MIIMINLLALMAIMFFPVIPLFWIPVHYETRFFRSIGLFTYLLPAFLWPFLAYLIYQNSAILLQFRIDLPEFLNGFGILLLVIGILLHIWTGLLLGLWGLIGVPEISTMTKGRLITKGPFSVVRHPTYLAHTLMFSGIFLITGVIAVGIVTLIDIIVVNSLIIPLEEKELLNRFGKEYESYKKRISRFFPGI